MLKLHTISSYMYKYVIYWITVPFNIYLYLFLLKDFIQKYL